MTPTPLVTVVMPVRNAMPYLDASIESILAQTLGDLELVIRDDASVDGSAEALRRWGARDARIRCFAGGEVLGPAGNSNWVARQARAPLVARMDADDISHPDRLRRQVEVMRRCSDVVLVGTLCDGIDARGRKIRGRDRWRLARPSPLPPFPHGSVLFRREVFERLGGYREACDYWEDNDLFLRFAREGRVVVLPEALYRFRFSTASSRIVTSPERMEYALQRMVRCHRAHVRGGSYEELLDARNCLAPGAKVSPTVFNAIGSTRLWAGERPAVFLRLLRRGDLGWNRESLVILVWAGLGALSPALLRRALAVRAWVRDWRVRHRFPDGTVHDWRVPHPPGRRPPGEAAPAARATAAVAGALD